MAANVISDNEHSFYLDSSRSTASQQVTFSVWFDLPPATDSDSGHLALLTRQWAYALYIKKDSDNKYQLVCFDFKKGGVLHVKHEFLATASSPYHAVFTLNGTHAALYLNGIIKDTITDFSIHNLHGQTYIGASDNYNPNDKTRAEKSVQHYPGSIKRATLFNRALTSSEVSALNRLGRDQAINSLIGSGQAIDYRGSQITATDGRINPIRAFDVAVTYAVWFKKPTINTTDLLSLVNKDGFFELLLSGNNLEAYCLPGIKFAKATIADNEWHHAVVTIQASTGILYLDGNKTEWSSKILPPKPNGDTRISGTGKGEISRVTIFDRCLSASEVARLYRRKMDKTVMDLRSTGQLWDYQAAQLPKNSSGKTLSLTVPATPPVLVSPPAYVPTVYPFEISLTNQKDNTSPALYIVSDVARTTDVQTIDITIKNTTADTYQFDSFTLSFRKGTLHEDLTKNIEAVKAQNFCTLLKTALGTNALVTVTEDHDNIHFLVKKSATEKFSFPSPSISFLKLTLSGVYAAPGTGTRTSGYEVKFQGVQKMLGTTPSGSAFTFGRNAVLQIINHQGDSYAPVHFGVLGNNFLLNNNPAKGVNYPGAQSFTMFMQSLDGKALKMNEKTKFTFSFYSSHDSDDKLIGNDGSVPFGNRSEVNAISVGTLASGYSLETPTSGVDKFGKRDISIISKAGLEGSFVAFPFNHIQLSGTPGIIKVHVSIENLPGYWDSNFEVPFVKGPIVMQEDRVGINMQATGTNKLSIKGNSYIDGNVGVNMEPSVDNKLSIKGNSCIDGNVGIGTSNPTSKLEVNGEALIYNKTTIGKANANANLIVNGNVGIGTDAPTSKLEVNGEALIYNKTTIGKANANADLIVNGNVVIGTDAPTSKLEVKGRIKDKTGFVMPVGSIIAYGGAEVPEGWVLCFGQSLAYEDKYAELRSALGVNNVPDLRRKFILGAKAWQINETGGEESVTLTEEQMPSHKHIFPGDDELGNYADSSVSDIAYDATSRLSGNGRKYNTSPTGGNQPHNNMPPYYVLYYIVKY